MKWMDISLYEDKYFTIWNVKIQLGKIKKYSDNFYIWKTHRIKEMGDEGTVECP